MGFPGLLPLRVVEGGLLDEQPQRGVHLPSTHGDLVRAIHSGQFKEIGLMVFYQNMYIIELYIYVHTSYASIKSSVHIRSGPKNMQINK